MASSPLILFDDGVPQLAPLTDLRPSFDVRTGALTLAERVRLASRSLGLELAGVIVPPQLVALARERSDVPVNDDLRLTGAVRLLNGRAVGVGLPAVLGLQEGQRMLEVGTGDLVAACVRAENLQGTLAGQDTGAAVPSSRRCLMTRPWSVRTFRDEAILADLAALVADGRAQPWESGRTFVAESANVHSAAILDDTAGVIFIDEHAVVRPGAIIIGPAYVGPHSTILERATVRSLTSVGPWCKVNGEVGGTIFQGYANKAHDGYIGDSYLGEWVNLGAGTTGSNLLNTYGEVVSRATPSGPNERTGETFLGCVLGDHVKTAICTRIMTGAVVHTGTMFAASSPLAGCVPAFSWITDAGQRSFRFEKFVEVAEAAMARRKVVPSRAYLQRLAEISQKDGPSPKT